MVFGFSTAAIGGLRLALRARPRPKLTFKHVGPEGNYGSVGAARVRRLTLCLGTAGLRRRFPRGAAGRLLGGLAEQYRDHADVRSEEVKIAAETLQNIFA